MRGRDLLNGMELADPAFVEAADGRAAGKKRSRVRWGVTAACLCLAVLAGWFALGRGDARPDGGGIDGDSAGTLPGAAEIYPAVMVENRLYEWRRGAAIAQTLPQDSVYYGEIRHAGGKTPNGNGEFVSTFDAAGQIYTRPDDPNSVYLVLTTDWMKETVVAFDLVC